MFFKLIKSDYSLLLPFLFQEGKSYKYLKKTVLFNELIKKKSMFLLSRKKFILGLRHVVFPIWWFVD